MSETLHIVCPHCQTTNRVRPDHLASHPDCGKCHQPLFTGHPVELDDVAAFDKHLTRSQIPLLVDFWAPWCSYCNKLTPVLEEVSAELAGKLKIVKINVDENRSLAQRYDIKGLPTMMLVKDGEVAEKIVGFLPKTSILGKIEPLL